MDDVTDIYQSLVKHYSERYQAEVAWYVGKKEGETFTLPAELVPAFKTYQDVIAEFIRISSESILHAVAHVIEERELK